jgi:serine phosphatase RsbU (regulator of sigma subunit)
VAKSTGIKKTPQAPKKQMSALHLIQEVEGFASELASLWAPSAIVKALTKRLVERYGVEASGVWLTNDQTSQLELGASAGKPTFPRGFAKASLTKTIVGKAVRSRQPQTVSLSAAQRDALANWARQGGLGFLAAYPLLHDSKAQGVLLIACAKPPEEHLLALFRLQARFASLALRDTQLLDSVQRTLGKMSLLAEASKALGSTLDLTELLGRILDVAKTHAQAERGTLFLIDEKTEEIWSLIAHGLEQQEIRLPLGKGIAGHVAKTGETVNISDAYADPRFNPEVDQHTGYRTRNILCLAIRNKSGKIIAALELLNRKDGQFTDEDIDILLTLSGHMALALENAQLHKELLGKERLEKELALARGIQRSLLPETTPLVEGFDIALLNEPCYEVGGDYYDFLSLGPHTLLVVIADVEGKGVSSAMVMSNLQATLRALVLQLHSLNEIAEALNKMILDDTRGGKYLSMFLGLIDTRRKAIHYINCGHVPPAVIRTNQEVLCLTEGGMVIGLFQNVQYERGQAKFEPGDILVLCTDGITEAMDADHDEYGMERLLPCVRAVADRKATEIVSAVSSDVARFSRTGTHVDDKVMMVIKVL